MIAELLGGFGSLVGAGGLILAATIPARTAARADAKARAIDEHDKERDDDLARLKVQQTAYDKAQAINDRIVLALQREINRLNKALAELRAELQVAKHTNEVLAAKVVEMQQTVERMRDLLARHQIPTPD